ncbi:MAG: terminase small subunit [Alphaproteobacteria bacterium]|nr:terminase small subunit [Alphaproteobacteria bacterium]
MALKEQQKRFCKEYVIDCNATQAAIRAGYAKQTAKQQGSRLLTNVDVSAEIERLSASVHKKLEISAERVLQELAAIAFDEKKHKTVDRLSALDKLGKHLKLFTEQHEQLHSFNVMPTVKLGGKELIFDVGTPASPLR